MTTVQQTLEMRPYSPTVPEEIPRQELCARQLAAKLLKKSVVRLMAPRKAKYQEFIEVVAYVSRTCRTSHINPISPIPLMRA
jgi:hypothetical protein